MDTNSEDHPNNFESMYQSVTKTVDDMRELKASIEEELKQIRNDINTIVQDYELRISLLETKVEQWKHIKYVGVGGLFGTLLTITILLLLGIV